MISQASNDIKNLLDGINIIDLDIGKEINSHGNYLVFNAFHPEPFMRSGSFDFTLFMALNSLKRANQNAYSDLDEIIEKIASAGEKNIICECRGIELNQFGERLFIYAVKLKVTRSW